MKLLQGASKTALISRDRSYRYLLTRAWSEETPLTSLMRLAFVMLNPSTADHEVDDPTIRRCTSFARRGEHSGLEVANLFAWRCSDPKQLDDVSDPVGPENDVASLLSARAVVCAWGSGSGLRGEARDLFTRRARFVCQDLINTGHVLLCLGTTKDGHPRHPLYVPAATPLVTFHPALYFTRRS